MAKQQMLRFVTVERETPPSARRICGPKISVKSTASLPPKRQQSKQDAAASVACPIAKATARCTTTSPTG